MADQPRRPRRDPRTDRIGRRRREPPQAQGQDLGSGQARLRIRRQRTDQAPTDSVSAQQPQVQDQDLGSGEVEVVDHAQRPDLRSGEVEVIDHPSCLIVAVPDLPQGRLTSHDRDLLGAARVLAEAAGGAVLAIVFGAAKDDLGAAGVDRVVGFTGPQFEGYVPEPKAQAVLAAMAAHRPAHVLFPDSPWGGADLGRRVAAEFGQPVITNAWRIGLQQTTRTCVGGTVDVTSDTTMIVLVAAEAAQPVAGVRYEARPIEPPSSSRTARVIEDLGLSDIEPHATPLAEAEFVVSAGSGVKDWAAFHDVAQTLGATEGGSRVVVDANLMPRDRQVGASGTVVSARCYVSLGISGAPQHLQGIAECEYVVAVNTDPNCDMVKRADLVVIGDVQAIMPELARIARLVDVDSDTTLSPVPAGAPI